MMNRTIWIAGLLTVATSALSSGCVVGTDEAPLSYEAFKTKFVTTVGTQRFYDSDQPLTSPRQLKALYAAYAAAKTGGESTSEASVMRTIFGDDKWSPEAAQALSYCVSDAFGGDKGAVVAAMATATGDWQNVTGAIRFAYAPAADASCTAENTDVMFNVVPSGEANGNYATAFFPSQARGARQLIIYPALALAPDRMFPLEGILRHELGHVLGLRHETNRAEAIAQYGLQCFEDAWFRTLTAYDDQSVMTTPACMGGAIKNTSLTISALDAQGIRTLYDGTPSTVPQEDADSWADDEW